MNQPNYHYHLPPSLIAQSPASPRDSSRLMQINRKTGNLSHHIFRELPQLLNPTDILVFNDTKVIPARLHAQKTTGGNVEILLLRKKENDLWEVISHPGIKPGQSLIFSSNVSATVVTPQTIYFPHSNIHLISQIGSTPIPPYIHSSSPEAILRRQYQTVYASNPGSAAAPTAGLHFTHRLQKKLADRLIQSEYITLHVGLGTFKSPTNDQIASGHLHLEWFSLSPEVAQKLNVAKKQHRRIIAVGTTTTRVLESCTDNSGLLHPTNGETDIFIKPPYQFKFVDGLITNFHLPDSSLLMLVSAFTSNSIIKRSYAAAIKNKYRFYSFGDACLFI